MGSLTEEKALGFSKDGGPRGPRNGGSDRRVDWVIPVRAKWRHLYDENEDFSLWFHNLARGSPTTATERARVLHRFLGWMGWSLDELTRQITEDGDMFEKRLMAFVGSQEEKGYAPGTIENYVKSVRSWANWHGVKLVRKIKISNRTSTPTLDSEEVPTVNEVQDIRSSATPRGRICVGAVAYGGMRPEVLGHQHVKDGLRLGDLPELDIEKLEFTRVPTLVVVRPEISKTGRQYRTFFPGETCRDIVAYLHKRRGEGEGLTRSSPLVAVNPALRRKGWRTRNGSSESMHIVTAVVSRDIRNAMRPVYSYRPYVLRSYFATRLLMAVSDKALDNNYRVYWLGHTGEISARYSSNKAMLPDDLVENMREAYNRSLRYLVGGTMSEEETRKKQMMDTARILGFDEDKLSALKEILQRSRNLDEAVIQFRKLEEQPSSEAYDIVSGEAEMLRRLEKGWTLERELNGDKFLMKRN
jgi:integrase